jgi:peroxiredoxin
MWSISKMHSRFFSALWLLGLSLLLLPALAASPGPQQGAAAPTVGHTDMIPDAPAFELKDVNGKIVRLQDYRGKAVLLNFWATWCVPCKTEIPWLVEFQKQYGSQGLVVLGVAMDSSAAPLRKFTRHLGINYPVLLGTQAVAGQYFVKGLPVSIYIDRSGRITDQTPGLTPRNVMENEIRLALINGATRKK